MLTHLARTPGLQTNLIHPRFSVKRHQTMLLIAVLVPVGVLLPAFSAFAQHDRRIPVEGYVTAVSSRDSFDVNDLHVSISSNTGFGIIGSNTVRHDSPLRDALQVGAFVEVTGRFDKHMRTTTAAGIYLRNDWDERLSGIGVIDKVVSPGPEATFRADGYQIRITSSTDLTFADKLNSLADIDTNIWIRYEGKRDKNGVLIASKVTFLPAKPAAYRKLLGGGEDPESGLMPASQRHAKKPAPNPYFDPPKPEIDPETGNRVDFEKTLDMDGNLTEDAGIRFGALGGWHTIPADKALQERVRRVGARIVPDYQKALAADHPSKIHFRFYAVDYDKFRGVMCPLTGLILIPKQVVERLQNDDQLAAVLTNGVAYNLQRQAARISADNRVLTGAYVAIAFAPAIVFLPALDAAVSTANKITIGLYEERARIALVLLSDAGYNPRQAPEAWRLLAPKHLPSDTRTLPYGDFSGYQLSILNLQYRNVQSLASPTQPGGVLPTTR
jgi:hypothetical protein